jgi:hypothetical protein
MRNRERVLLEDLVTALADSVDIVATLIEARESVSDEDPIAYDLRALYLGLHTLMDDAEDIERDL